MSPLRIIMTLPGDVHARLQSIEDNEGVNSIDLIVEAVSVWSHMTSDERRSLTFNALQMIANRRFATN